MAADFWDPEFWNFVYHLLLRGLWVTLEVTALGIVVAVVVAFTAGIGRLSDHWPVRWVSLGFVELFRGTSLVAQLFFFFYALPQFGVQLAPLAAGVIAIGLNEGAYAAEIVRGAIQGRTAGQNEACIALNMGKTLRMRRVLIPQSIPSMLPSFGNVAVDLLKNSSLVFFITVVDLTARAEQIRAQFGRSPTVYLVLLLIYFVLSQVLALLTRVLENRFAIDRTRRSILRGGGPLPAGAGTGGFGGLS